MSAELEELPVVDPDPDDDALGGAESDEDDEAADDQDDELDDAEADAEHVGGARDDVDVEKATKKLQAEAERHAKRLGEIMGEDVLGLVTCPLCPPHLAGWRFPVAADEETRRAVRMALGWEDENELQKDSYSRVCDKCSGQGKVKSGSLVPGQETLVCIDCKGQGWKAVGAERESGVQSPIPPAELPHDQQPAEPPPELDPWNRPIGHPDYGKLPQFSSQPLPEQPPVVV